MGPKIKAPPDRYVSNYWMLIGKLMPVILGLAVSGGVDSMALATLCTRFRDQFILKAFIVDHGARPGSYDEALEVAKYLKSHDLKTEILRIKWLDRETKAPNELSDFETQARTFRYRALGAACRRNSIHALLLAHHEDDQAETVLMRVANNHHGPGLQATSPVSDIPECFGMYACNLSGGWPLLLRPKDADTSKSPSLLGIEDGGVKLYRPLMDFSKERLIATCNSLGTKWFEDRTNEDHTLTQRNAIRHMMRENLLPTALQKDRLLELNSKWTHRNSSQAGRTKERIEHVKFKLDIRTGCLTVNHFPEGLYHYTEIPKLTHEAQLSRTRNLRLQSIQMLQWLFKLVTPTENVPQKTLVPHVSKIFPQLWKEEAEQIPAQVGFAVGGVYARIVRPENADGSEDAQPIWLFSRQPFETHQLVSLVSQPDVFPGHVPTTVTKYHFDKPTSWTLWDGRFWFLLYNSDGAKYRIRPFLHRDRRTFLDSLPRKARDHFKSVIRDLAPDKVRFTLPAIARVDQDAEGTELDEIVALPTLGWRLPNVHLQWLWRYKHVELGKHNIDVLDPPCDRVSFADATKNTSKPTEGDDGRESTKDVYSPSAVFQG
ncbi:MAG: hypothetical protein M1820_001161 [Bogoriella megaspora]|nr:MAG: hypothetical protein M1820_001161 [Bogoriella megaspora]